MQLTLVDSLRCPAHDEATALVLSVEEWAGPRVAEGLLGCPVCHARYRIHRGAVDFAPGTERVRHVHEDVDPARLAAQLALMEPGGIILLSGHYASVHEELGQFVEITIVLVDAPATSAATAVNFHVSERLPFVDRALRGAALHNPRSTPAFVTETVRCVRAGGRIVSPASAAVPPAVQVIARDETEWVGAVVNRIDPVPLRRAEPRE